jgi:hypothetical protein
MATGRDTKLTSALGEYLVAAQLSRRGFVAAPFAGNVPHYDIVAVGVNGTQHVVQVKTTNGKNWQLSATSFLEIELHGKRQVLGRKKRCPVPGMVCVLVRAAAKNNPDEFYVLSWAELQDIIVAKYRKYLRSHNFVRPSKPESVHTKADTPGDWGRVGAARALSPANGLRCWFRAWP